MPRLRRPTARIHAGDRQRDIFYGLGSSLYHLKDYAGAEAAYRQANTLAPDDAASLAGWADSLAKLGRTGEAIAAYERAVQSAPDYITWLSLGMPYEQAGQFADSASAYGKASEIQPDDAWLTRRRGGCGSVWGNMRLPPGIRACPASSTRRMRRTGSRWRSTMPPRPVRRCAEAAEESCDETPAALRPTWCGPASTKSAANGRKRGLTTSRRSPWPVTIRA